MLTEHTELQSEYDTVSNRQIFPRKYFRTISINTTYDMKRMPILESMSPESTHFAFGPSDGSNDKTYSYDHVRFSTRPLYSADEYRQLLYESKRNMNFDDYKNMLEELVEGWSD